MGPSWLFLFLMIASLVVQGFYSMLEMACVSFNRVRLQYFVSQKSKRAQWLSSLLNRPTYLFGTTLIGVNTALQFGSEFSRRFYETLGVSPDWAPFSQVFIVLIFAELVPMFAARRFAESIAMLGIPIIYITSIILRPFIWVLDGLCYCIRRVFKTHGLDGLYLTREELQKAIEIREDNHIQSDSKEFDPVLVNIFTLKNKTAADLMDSIETCKMLSSESTKEDLSKLLGLEAYPFVPVYHNQKHHIVAIGYTRDFLKLSKETRIRPYCRPPWFITEKNSILEIIKEFRYNNQSLAIVLTNQGVATGVLTLDAVVDEIFGHRDDWVSFGEYSQEKHRILIDRSFPGNTQVSDVNHWLGIDLSMENEEETLEELMFRRLGGHLEQGDLIIEGQLKLIVHETSLMTGKTILIQSINE